VIEHLPRPPKFLFARFIVRLWHLLLFIAGHTLCLLGGFLFLLVGEYYWTASLCLVLGALALLWFYRLMQEI
jgi:hypothetical protein